MEEVGLRAAIFDLEGFSAAEKLAYPKWLLAQCVTSKTDIATVLTENGTAVALGDLAHHLAGERAGSHAPVPVDGPEEGAVGDLGGGQPGAQGTHRAKLRIAAIGDGYGPPGAFLVGRRSPDCYARAIVRELELGRRGDALSARCALV